MPIANPQVTIGGPASSDLASSGSSSTATRASNRLSVSESGSGPATLVFIHGITCDTRDWYNQMAALSAQYHCIAIDLPGHGASPMPNEATIEALADGANRELAARSVSNVILIGHSMGCRVISAMYSQAPQSIKGLAYIDGSILGEGDPEMAATQLAKTFDDVGTTLLLDRIFADFSVESTPASIRSFIDSRRSQVNEELAKSLFISTAKWDARRAHEVLRSINVPVCVVQSTKIGTNLRRVALQKGENTPWMKAVQLARPNASMHVVEGVGHFTMIEAPNETSRIIDNFSAAALR